MARLQPLNQAVCTACGEKNTKRAGYSKKKGGSVWRCEGCGNSFVVPLLVMSSPGKVRTTG